MKRWYFWYIALIMVYFFHNHVSASFFVQTDQSDHMVSLFPGAKAAIDNTKIPQTLSTPDQTSASHKRDYLLKTLSGISIHVTMYERGSKDLIVFGQGFPGRRESGEIIADIFSDYDVVLFDYRWARMANFLISPETLFHPVDKFLLEEDEEVTTVVNFVKSKKHYDQVIGLAHCYSCFTFAKAHYLAESTGSSLFTKLIFDSCWYSLYDLGEQFLKDPALSSNPQSGGTPYEIKNVLHSPMVRAFFQSIMYYVVPDITIVHYLSRIKNSPILFIHGTHDLLVPFKTVFDKVWSSVAARKACFITPHAHSESILDSKLYYFIATTFIHTLSVDDFFHDVLQLLS